jgi:hypothetical protein
MLDFGATVGSYLGSDYVSYIMATSFSVGGSRSTRREPLTMGKQLFVIYKAGREPMPKIILTG